MKRQSRKASWFVSGLLVVALVSAGWTWVMAQPKSETPRPASQASEADFVPLGQRYLVNIHNVAYTTDEGTVFDIFFACSSAKSSDPLRLADPKDIRIARNYFNDPKKFGDHFLKVNKYNLNVRNIAFLESRGDSLVIRFNSRQWDSFLQFTLYGADAETFRKQVREL